MSKILEAYFLAGIFVTLLCFACGKHNAKLTDDGQHRTDKSHNQLQHLTDDDSLITTVEKPPPKHTSDSTRARQAKITSILVTSANKMSSKLKGNKQHKFQKGERGFTNKSKQFLQKVRHSINWLRRIVDKSNAISKKVIRRKSRDDSSFDDDNIQSKEEDEDEDVQLIIIPKKPRKHLRPKIQDADENDNEEIQKSDYSLDDSEDNNISENDSENSEDEYEDSEKDSKKPSFISKNFRQRLKNYQNFHKNSKSKDDDATLTLERVAPAEDDDDNKSKNKQQSEDYDIHLKVKDRDGTHVKLSGDLPGKIENLMAVGEDGGEVQIKNTRKNSKSSEDLKIVNSQGRDDDATTDEMAQNLLKIKSGKLKHSPYPSTVLLKTDGSVNENPKLASEGMSTKRPTPLKTQSSDEPHVLPASALTPLTRDEANAKAEQPANQQPSNNIFAPMEFENGDDELMATSRLLDIAQKADDVSSLKDVKDPSNTVKEQPKESIKDLTKGIAEKQISKAFLKSAPVSPEDYNKQSEDIDKESTNNWYKMQSLEDRVVNEGSSAKTGKDVGSYNGTSPPIVLPDETIHGTRRHRFEIHDLTDVSGGKWKAVHIPDQDISSMLEIANQKNNGKMSLDIQHETTPDPLEDEVSGVQMPNEVHGRVHAFEHNFKNNSKSVNNTEGKLIVAMENEHRGKEVGSLHSAHSSVIKLRGYAKEEGPKNREVIHRKTSVKPSLVVAKIPDDEDDSDSDDLPLRKLPTPIIAPLRKTPSRIKPGSMRSDILAGVIHPANKPRVVLTPKSTASENPRKTIVAHNTTSTQNKAKSSQETDDPSVLEKIKSLLLKSRAGPKQPSTNIRAPTKTESQAITQSNLLASKQQNQDGLFLPPSSPRPSDAFSNHASVLNRISEPKREALLIGIIRALLARSRVKTPGASRTMNGAAAGLPHYNRQAILQGLQNLQMSKTVGSSQNDQTVPSNLGTTNPAMSGKNLDEIYQKEREEDVKEELGRANEEALEAKKMRFDERQMLANYNNFLNPESGSNWGKVAGMSAPTQSQTPDGQMLSMLGSQQLNMLEDNPTQT